MERYKIACNAYGFDLDFQCKESDGSAKVLTDYTITLKAWRTGSPANAVVSGSCDIDDAAGGLCHYTVQSTDFTVVDVFRARLWYEKAGIKEKSRMFEIEVEESA